MVPYLTYCANLSISSLWSKDNNVIVGALELFQVLFETYTDEIILAWGRQKTDDEIKRVLTQVYRTTLLQYLNVGKLYV